MKRYDIDFGSYEESSTLQSYEDAVTVEEDGDWVKFSDMKALHDSLLEDLKSLRRYEANRIGSVSGGILNSVISRIEATMPNA